MNAQNNNPIVVVGDVMLDKYLFGQVKRISPEAPVPVVKVKRYENRLGGAANVAANIAALNGASTLLGQIGNDAEGQIITTMLAAANIKSALQISNNVPTITKMRVIGHQQQMLRIDTEDAPDVSWLCVRDTVFNTEIKNAASIILSDYGKGALDNCQNLIACANAAQKPVIVDPKGRDWQKYAGAFLISPNRSELADVVGDWRDENDLESKAQNLRTQLNIGALLVTRSEDGMTLFDKSGRFHVPTVAREVYDVSGAGDTVIATLALMLAEGYDLQKSVSLANIAAGVVVGKLGTATLSRDELFGRGA